MGRTCNNDDSMGRYNWNEHKFTLLVWIQSYLILLDRRGAQIDSNCGKNKSLIVKGAIQLFLVFLTNPEIALQKRMAHSRIL